jgi:hypothetical protein
MPMIFFAGFKIGWFGLLSKDKRKGSIWSSLAQINLWLIFSAKIKKT